MIHDGVGENRRKFGLQRGMNRSASAYWASRFAPGAAAQDPAMKIDIDKLSEPELIDLNHRIVARLRFLREMRAHAEMLEFRIGDRVTFQPPGHRLVEGMLTRYNKKTVTVITEDGGQWNVSPII
jgi:hypothetical protein